MPAFHQKAHGELEMSEAILRAAMESDTHPGGKKSHVTLPFVTVSRQAGASGGSFARELIKRLNARSDATWSCWDHEGIRRAQHRGGGRRDDGRPRPQLARRASGRAVG